jgi:ribosomal protein S27E
MTPRLVVECPHCGEATQVNRLAQDQASCSCAAQRPLPLPGKAGDDRALKEKVD